MSERITATQGWRGITVVDEDPRHGEPAPDLAAPSADAEPGADAGADAGVTVSPRVRPPRRRRREPAWPRLVGAMTR